MNVSTAKTKIRRITGTTTSDWSDAEMIEDLNGELSQIQIAILRDRGVLEFDDANHTDVPVGTFSVAADGYCKIVEDENSNLIQTIHKVAFLTSDGTYVDVPRKTLGEDQQSILTDSATRTIPTEYYEVGHSIVFPGVSSGTAKIWFDRDLSQITTSDTTKILPVPTAYHKVACYRTALNYDDLPDNKVQKIMVKLAKYELELELYEENRRADEPVIMGVTSVSGL